jgi:hypothetical protein
MENSRLIAILQMMRSGIESSLEFPGSGLCGEVEGLFWNDTITEWENTYMMCYLHEHKPDHLQYTEFTKLDCWVNNMYWWTPIYKDKATIQVRMEYLDVLIKELTDARPEK